MGDVVEKVAYQKLHTALSQHRLNEMLLSKLLLQFFTMVKGFWQFVSGKGSSHRRVHEERSM